MKPPADFFFFLLDAQQTDRVASGQDSEDKLRAS
jgi:hypothetical protein